MLKQISILCAGPVVDLLEITTLLMADPISPAQLTTLAKLIRAHTVAVVSVVQGDPRVN